MCRGKDKNNLNTMQIEHDTDASVPTTAAKDQPNFIMRGGRWGMRHPVWMTLLVVSLGFVLLNILAFTQARAMTHFTREGKRTRRPESLSLAQKLWVLATGVGIPRPANERTPESLGLPFTCQRFQSTDGTNLEGWLIPRAQAKGIVLLFHGYASCKACLLGEARAFHDWGYTCFLVDFRGSGGSNGMVTTVGVEEAGDVAAAVQFVQAQWPGQPIILYGQSMGSAAILRAIRVHGVRPAAVVLECPFDRLLATVENRFHAMGLPSFPAAALIVFWGGVQHGFNGFRHNPAEYARATICPTLLLYGENDQRVTQQQAASVFENLGGEKERHMFPGLGHEDYLATCPAFWKQWVGDFLRRVRPAQRG
ncbi:MAG TPA: alpha/beta fold hydrolase [Gemmataceae bacterium]|nr:alpha/beta fold hydrolase [Gemmataceae bacterium]